MMQMIIKVRMAVAVLIFILAAYQANSQCVLQFSDRMPMSFHGLATGDGQYYRNLIIQDLALERAVPPDQVSITGECLINWELKLCNPAFAEIRVRPVRIVHEPVLYRGFDISSSIHPGESDLVFYIAGDQGIPFDSLTMRRVQVEGDSGLYVATRYPIEPAGSRINIRFGRALCRFDADSYDNFRQMIQGIDRYYAAAAVADSALRWVRSGFLSEDGDLPRLQLRLFELERIIGLCQSAGLILTDRDSSFDPARLRSRLTELSRARTRLIAIISGKPDGMTGSAGLTVAALSKDWFNWLDHYYSLSFRSDFANHAFFIEMSAPAFSQAFLNHLREHFAELNQGNPVPQKPAASILISEMMDRGKKYELAHDQSRALEYYRSASGLAIATGRQSLRPHLQSLECRMRSEIMASFLEISRKALAKNNPVMAVQYYRKARGLSADDPSGCQLEIIPAAFAQVLLDDMMQKAADLAQNGNYSRSWAYLSEIENLLQSDPALVRPQGLAGLMMMARQGVYAQMVRDSGRMLLMDDAEEGISLFQQAEDMRLTGAFNIVPVAEAEEVSRRITRLRYDSYLDEAASYSSRNEPDLALYYLNKAWALHTKVSPASPALEAERVNQARLVIDLKLSEAKFKAWARDYEEARKTLAQAKGMFRDYGISDSDLLYTRYRLIFEDVFSNECEIAVVEFDSLMANLYRFRGAGDYIAALDYARRAVNHSLDHLSCRIQDEAAWQQKIELEPLAGFKAREKDLDRLAKKPVNVYIQAYREFQQEYYRKRLLNEGLVLEPLIEKAEAVRDTAFLSGMFDYYAQVKDFPYALRMLKRLKDEGVSPAQTRKMQWSLARSLARRDAPVYTGTEPWFLMHEYVGDDPYFRVFRWSYRLYFIGEDGWNIRYWPIIWKK